VHVKGTRPAAHVGIRDAGVVCRGGGGSAGVITARARCNFLSARSKLPLDGVSCAASLRGRLPGARSLHVNDVFTR